MSYIIGRTFNDPASDEIIDPARGQIVPPFHPRWKDPNPLDFSDQARVIRAVRSAGAEVRQLWSGHGFNDERVGFYAWNSKYKHLIDANIGGYSK